MKYLLVLVLVALIARDLKLEIALVSVTNRVATLESLPNISVDKVNKLNLEVEHNRMNLANLTEKTNEINKRASKVEQTLDYNNQEIIMNGR